jgi:hypothetical protein
MGRVIEVEDTSQRPTGATNPHPTLSEIAKAKPLRGTGAPSNTRSHYTNAAKLLCERGEQGSGIHGSYLYEHPELYGRSPRNRIHELRQDGWIIGSKRAAGGLAFYWLIRDNTGRSYPTSQHGEAPPARARKSETAWKDRKPVTGLELWDAAAVRQ